MPFIPQKYRSFRQAQGRSLILSTFAVFTGLISAQAAFAANITVASPVNGTSNSSPVWVRAHNAGCNNLAPTAFGFSVDNSGTTTSNPVSQRNLMKTSPVARCDCGFAPSISDARCSLSERRTARRNRMLRD